MEFNKAYSRLEFIQFLKVFLPFDTSLTKVEEIHLNNRMQFATSAVKLGESESLDLKIFEISHNSKKDARVGLSKDAFRMMADEGACRALVIFVPDDSNDNYRFSFIELTLDWDGDNGIRRTYSNPRRYSYYLGEGIAYHTPNKYLNQLGRVTSAEDLRKRFSVEVLTKEFYTELSIWYAWALTVIQFPIKIKDEKKRSQFIAENTIRLVTRLIFVWFLKQKDLVPEEFFDDKFISEKLLKDFNPHKLEGLFQEKSKESKYYKAILQNLFFAMLNCPITKSNNVIPTERRFSKGNSNDHTINKYMRYKELFKDPDLFINIANSKVPYLNGGLFECLDSKKGNEYIYIDAFTERAEINKQLIVPDFLFFGEEAGKNIDLSEYYGDDSKKRVSAIGIIDLLEKYNFTVEENTPFDQEVSLDPELLGKVFENLLASYNPETKTTARKQTGSFYTPREIVQYMVDESLVEYLKRTVDSNLESQFRSLIQYDDSPIELTEVQKETIIKTLYECKVIDPACGSGAFPVGMLQQMVHILSQIDPSNNQWKKIVKEDALKETAAALDLDSKEEREEYLQDIENSFDEKLSNPDYARKLYLIEHCIYGVDIQPIAVQISKLRFFISLVVDQKTNNNPADNFGVRPLPNLEANFVAANTLMPLSKNTDNLGRTPDVIKIENELKEANHKIFNAKTYKTKTKWRKKFEEKKEELKNILKDNGFLTNDGCNQIDSWKPFDQNSYTEFFDPEWMFGIKDGFEIVIANPPFVEAKKLKNIVAPFKNKYKLSSGTADLSIYFFEVGFNMLVPNGILCFISTNKFFNTGYGKKLRQHLINNKINRIINFEQVEVFENVLVSSVIVEAIKSRTPERHEFTYEKFYRLNYADFRKQFVARIGSFGTYLQQHLNEKEWSFADVKGLALKAKLEKGALPLASINGVNVFRGVTTGYNPAFLIDGNKRATLLEKDKTITNIIKKMLQGRNVRKWYFLPSCEYIIQTGYDLEIPTLYPEILKHFEPFKDNMIARSDKGLEWYNLRACRYYSNFEYDEKIIWGLTANKWAFTLDTEKHYLPSNGYILTSENIETKYILGLLNSKLMEHYFSYIGVMTAGGAYTLKAATIEALPFKIANNPDLIIDLVSQILYLKEVDNSADVSSLENEIDKFVYRLYDLVYEEILIIDPNTPIAKEEYENYKID